MDHSILSVGGGYAFFLENEDFKSENKCKNFLTPQETIAFSWQTQDQFCVMSSKETYIGKRK